MQIDPKIVDLANRGAVSSYGQSKLNQIMNMPDYENRAKNLSALRSSLEILGSSCKIKKTILLWVLTNLLSVYLEYSDQLKPLMK